MTMSFSAAIFMATSEAIVSALTLRIVPSSSAAHDEEADPDHVEEREVAGDRVEVLAVADELAAELHDEELVAELADVGEGLNEDRDVEHSIRALRGAIRGRPSARGAGSRP